MIKLGVFGLMLAAILLCCGGGAIQEKGSGSCHELWADCPGVAEDYKVNDSVFDVKQKVVFEERFFSYYNCELGYRTQTLIIGAECELVSSDPR